MTDVERRGSWTVDEAITNRWQNANLDAEFKRYWPNPLATEYPVLHDEVARPVPPGPYCVYEKMEPDIVGHSTGKEFADTEQQTQMVTIQFRIHAANTSTKSGKEIAAGLCDLIQEAFDPDHVLDMQPDYHIVTTPGPDWHVREGDEEWLWIQQYDILIDATYLAYQPG